MGNNSFKQSRREFLQTGSLFSFSALIGSHLLLEELWHHSETENLGNYISGISLKTDAEIGQLVEFYGTKLGFPVISQSEDSCRFQTGESTLAFERVRDGSSPFYHFAFNIPENKIKAAEQWQAARSEFIQPQARLNDPAMKSTNIVHFRHWDAHSVFFYDPAGNVVEYIARHTMDNAADGKFSAKDILYLSEMGLVTDKVSRTANGVKNRTGLSTYKSSSENFHALGNEGGLIIFFKQGTKAAFEQGRDRNIFEARVDVNLPTIANDWKVGNYPYVIGKV